MGKNLGLVLELTGNSTFDSDMVEVFGTTSEDEFQIAFEVFDVNGDLILPQNLVSGKMTISIKPFGQGDFIPADHIIDLTNNEFFRPFRVNPDAIRLQVTNLDPVTATVKVRITAV